MEGQSATLQRDDANRRISLIIPARNESESIGAVVNDVLLKLPGAEVIVVNGGSEDETARFAPEVSPRLTEHSYANGKGASIKTKARDASGDVLVCMDAN